MSSIGPSGQSRGWLVRLELPTSPAREKYFGELFDKSEQIEKRRREWEALAENT